MLTRFVRIQLIIFLIASVVGLSVMLVQYLQAPMMLGINRITVTVNLPAAGGLYRFANVTYRGIEVGKVTEMNVDREGAIATLSLNTTPRIPADVQVQVRSVSAVGEQYVDLRPLTAEGPFLRDGSVIDRPDTLIPQQVAPMMKRLDALVGSIPKENLNLLLDESLLAFDGAGPQLRSLLDSSARITGDLDGAGAEIGRLIDDAVPLVDGQLESADALRSWSQGLAGVTGELVANDSEFRRIAAIAPQTTRDVTQLLEQVKPTLPVLLANLSTVGQIGVTYRPALEQMLVLLPPLVAYYQASAPGQNATGIPIGDFRISVSDPPSCTVGFLPPSAWRSPADTTTIDTPDGVYCKLPQDSPIAVRGARNSPCMGVPGKYAPTVQECYSDKPYTPLAMRQHALGPYPFDPNLVAQGIPPDDRVTGDENLFGPLPGAVPAPPPAPPAPAPPGPPVAFAHYDPETGKFATPDGQVASQTNLVNPPGDWQQLILPAGATS
ncbi:MAG: MlaD family protein [Mycobacterium sp.]|nr:MlaD family protein [Mycobacterium sp.]